MPSIYDRHEEFVIGFITEGRGSTIRNFKEVFAQESSGFIMPIKLQLDNVFIERNDCIMGALLSKRDTSSHYIIFDKAGGIHGCTEHFYK